jgi:hypothetical protein
MDILSIGLGLTVAGSIAELAMLVLLFVSKTKEA